MGSEKGINDTAKTEDATPVTNVAVDPLLEVGKLNTLLPPDLAASFAEGLRQLNLLQAHATKLPAAAMKVTTFPAEEKKENPVPLASLLLSSSFAARPSGSPSPTRGLRKSRSLSPEGGKSRSRSKDRGPLIPLEEPPLGTEATHGNGCSASTSRHAQRLLVLCFLPSVLIVGKRMILRWAIVRPPFFQSKTCL